MNENEIKNEFQQKAFHQELKERAHKQFKETALEIVPKMIAAGGTVVALGAAKAAAPLVTKFVKEKMYDFALRKEPEVVQLFANPKNQKKLIVPYLFALSALAGSQVGHIMAIGGLRRVLQREIDNEAFHRAAAAAEAAGSAMNKQASLFDFLAKPAANFATQHIVVPAAKTLVKDGLKAAGRYMVKNPVVPTVAAVGAGALYGNSLAK